MVQSLDSRQDEEENGYESVQEMVVNLPEYMDCSVVGSKFVPDYCTEGMQVMQSMNMSVNVMYKIRFFFSYLRLRLHSSVCVFTKF